MKTKTLTFKDRFVNGNSRIKYFGTGSFWLLSYRKGETKGQVKGKLRGN